MDENGTNGWGGPTGGDADWPSSGVGSPAAMALKRRESAPKRAFATIGFLLDATRRRRGGRLTLWFLVVAMALGGLGLLLYPVATDLWADRIQGRLENELGGAAGGTAADKAAFRASLKEGDALTRIKIPKIGVNVIVVEGISGNALRAGAGHYPGPEASLPCEPGNVAIAGHRTGFGEPFRHLDRLTKGDKIVMETPFGSCTYEVMGGFDGHSNPWVTHAKDWTVVSQTPESVLTLTTCDPPGTSLKRLIVRARLIG